MSIEPRSLPAHRLHDHLSAIASEISAQALLAIDGSGNIVECAGQTDRNNATLAALGAANLAATHEMSRLAGIENATQWPQTLLIEGKQGAVILAEGWHGLNFITVLSPQSVVGLARLEMRGLAMVKWEDLHLDRADQAIGFDADLMNELALDL